MIYLNAAGHGLPDPSVRARMIAYLQREDEIGQPAAELEAAGVVSGVRARIAALINADADEIALPDWTTLGWNAAALSMSLAGRRVLMAPGEWMSNVALVKRLDARVEVMPVDGDGALDVPALAGLIDDDVALIAAPMVCSLTGERYPVEAIGALDRPADSFFAVDAAQALGQMPVDVDAIRADVLAAPTRKWLRAPRGTGMLYVRRSALARLGPNLMAEYATLQVDGEGFADLPTAARFEKGGPLVVQRVAVAAALDAFDEKGAAAISGRLSELAAHIRGRADDAGIVVAGAEPLGSAIVTLRTERDVVAGWTARLTDAGIIVKNAAPSCEPLRTTDDLAAGFLRISPHIYNTEAEIDRAFDVLMSDKSA